MLCRRPRAPAAFCAYRQNMTDYAIDYRTPPNVWGLAPPPPGAKFAALMCRKPFLQKKMKRTDFEANLGQLGLRLAGYQNAAYY